MEENLEEQSYAFTGRVFKQGADYNIDINMDTYVMEVTAFRLSRWQQLKECFAENEHRQVRALNGQIQWVARMNSDGRAFAASELAGALSSPAVSDLMQASTVVRSIVPQVEVPEACLPRWREHQWLSSWCHP